MAFQVVSKCCLSHYTEEPNEYDGVEATFVCQTCKRPCERTRIGEPDGKPRTEAQAYADAFDKDGRLKPENDPEGFADKPNSLDSQTNTPSAPTIEIKDGKIYQNGKVIGTAIDDKTWFKETFGEEWKGSDDALKALRSR